MPTCCSGVKVRAWCAVFKMRACAAGVDGRAVLHVCMHAAPLGAVLTCRGVGVRVAGGFRHAVALQDVPAVAGVAGAAAVAHRHDQQQGLAEVQSHERLRVRARNPAPISARHHHLLPGAGPQGRGPLACCQHARHQVGAQDGLGAQAPRMDAPRLCRRAPVGHGRRGARRRRPRICIFKSIADGAARARERVV